MKLYHTIRLDFSKTCISSNTKYKDVVLTQKTAIFAFCKECMGGMQQEIVQCTDKHCPLYPFRNTQTHKEFKPVTKRESNLPFRRTKK